MYQRSSEDMSTSSEDDTSTAAAEAVSTANMCRTEIRQGEKVLRCTGCGYTSDRRANVTRHYDRIHGKLKKYRKCSCGDVFSTKWAFYEHCNVFHPSERQSWFTTTHVYKLKDSKRPRSNLKPVNKPRRKVMKVSTSFDDVEEMPLKIRLDSMYRSSTSSIKQEPFRSSGDLTASSSSESSTHESFETCRSADITKEESFKSSGESTTSFNDESLSHESFENFRSNESNDVKLPKFMPDFSHLPIKKRYLLYRKVFQDISNTCEVQTSSPVSDDNNNRRINRVDDFTLHNC